MSARHPGSISTNQKQSAQDIRLNYYEGGKIASLQSISPAQTFSLLSHGPTANAGTTHPVLYPFLIISGADIIDISLSGTYARYSNILLTSDNTTINFTNLIQNRIIKFTLDITIDTATFNSLTFNPTIENLPTLPTEIGERYLLEITAYKTATEETYFVTGGTLGGDGGGGGGEGLSEPVQLTFNEITPQTLPTKSTIDAGISNVHHIIIDRDIEFEIINPPPISKEEGLRIIIDIDGTGGYASPIWPPSLANPPEIPTTANTRFTVVLYTIDEGIIWTHATSVGSSSSGGITALSALDIDVNKNWQAQGIANVGALTGVTGIDMDGAAPLIQGVDKIEFLQAGQSIQNKADPNGGLLYGVAAVQSHIFLANLIEIARFEEAAAGVYRLEMLGHSIRDARDITFASSSGTNVFAGSSPAIGYDSILSNLVINFPFSAKIVISENNIIGSAEIKNNEFAADLLTANSSLLIGLLGGAPTVSGQFTNDGTDTLVFSGGSVRNLSNIGVVAGGADVFLSNLSNPTSINQNLIPQAGKTLGDSGNLWSAIHVNNLRLGTAGVISSSDNQIIGTTSGIDFNIPSGIGANYEFLTGGSTVGTISDSGTINFPFAIINIAISLGDAVSFPGNNGDMYREGADVKIVSGGIERNISDLTGLGANVNLSNLASPTAINQDLIPNGSFELGSFADRWNTLYVQFLDVTNTAIFGGDVILGNSVDDDISFNGLAITDLSFNLSATIDFNISQSFANSGSGSALPALPQTYIRIKQSGGFLFIPAYLG